MKRKWRLIFAVLICSLMIFPLASCKNSNTLQDGYYTAKTQDYSHGWKEFVTIMVQDGEIVAAEYNAENASGFIKSWDNAYMRNMLSVTGTYPNAYTRYYSSQLLDTKGTVQIQALAGATQSFNRFQKLTAAVVEQAKKGDSTTIIIDA